MIFLGIDDTDVPGSPGTNQFAKALADQLADQYHCRLIIRHQLLYDPRVPYTSKNGSAAMLLAPQGEFRMEPLIERLGESVRRWFVEGSDPGICVTTSVPRAVREFGKRCQQDLVTQQDARALAAVHGIYLQGFGGTEDGVIGALAAVGLAAGGNDGRVVRIGIWPDDLSGPQDVQTVRTRGVEVRCLDIGARIEEGTVDVGKHLRPNYREEKLVLFARPASCDSSQSNRWEAVRLT